jgi:hypothetical protein
MTSDHTSHGSSTASLILRVFEFYYIFRYLKILMPSISILQSLLKSRKGGGGLNQLPCIQLFSGVTSYMNVPKIKKYFCVENLNTFKEKSYQLGGYVINVTTVLG